MAGDPQRYPQVQHNSTESCNHKEISCCTFSPEVQHTLDAPPWDHLLVEPGDIDLADFDDEEVAP